MKRILISSRFLIGIPVICCLILTAGLVFLGAGRTITGMVFQLNKLDFSAKSAKYVSLAVVEIIDLFLVATVTYIVAIGLYKLFINKDEIKLPVKLTINNLGDLEYKIIGVIITALAVTFLGQAASEDARDLLNFGGGISLVIAALTFFVFISRKYGKAGSENNQRNEKSSD
jgi:uncharacterized membrane protein YqhA